MCISICQCTIFKKNLTPDPPVDTRSIFLDMPKAFDKVRHEGLLYRLKAHGVQGNLHNLLANYLTNRKQRTLINGQESGWNIYARVPQGSGLGPLTIYLTNSFVVQNYLRMMYH